MEALVFINVDIGTEDSVMEQLSKVPEVSAVFFVYGPYDLIVKLNSDDAEKLRAIIRDKIRKIPGVRSTTTLIVAKTLQRAGPPY
ncbi:MAG: Lrp/AsnC family transcriptional regulator [Thermoproteus sp.]|uniref:Transcriptional regulator, AsnC family n=1 Tax=Thermoproteus uzoniensis (strain 768-20) TaxID=999630 RepID=F2L600_THEU7|nr:Lrp/AsnC ligand binding domain-containing protein [Thermoproteus uzoniensis]AEA12445.1 putative transcriptional regulator, AsnC family [Thermoproteus uzoniensis 768-20]